MATIDAVIFDMDGLMIDSERAALKAWQAGAREVGLDLSDELFFRLIGRTGKDARRILREEFGETADLDALWTASDRHYHAAVDAGVPAKEGLAELLDLLEDKRVPKAVATSTRQQLARRKLSLIGVLERFSNIVSGDMVEHGKPAPDIFLMAAGKLGVSPQNCMVLEDSPMGITAAHAAGMLPVWIPDLIEPDERIREKCMAVANSLHDVVAFVQQDSFPKVDFGSFPVGVDKEQYKQ